MKQKHNERSKKGLFLWFHSTYSLQIRNKRRTSIVLSYFCILLPMLKFWKCLQWSEWYGATGENHNFEYKEDKATTQILHFNTKTIENKHFIHILKQFPQTLSVCFVMPTSKRKYQCFLILVQSFSACTFSRIYALIVSDTNFHQFGHTCSFQMAQTRSQNKTAAKQNNIHSNKKPRVFANEPLSANKTFFGALSQGLCTD